MPDSVPDTGNIAVTKTDKILCPKGAYILVQRNQKIVKPEGCQMVARNMGRNKAETEEKD